MPVATAQILVGNDYDWRIKGYRDSRITPIEDSYLNAATTATWELRTAADGGGSQVSNGSMTYVTGSNGEYVGGIDDAVVLTPGTTYWLTIILVQGGVKLYINRPIEAVRRTGNTPTT